MIRRSSLQRCCLILPGGRSWAQTAPRQFSNRSPRPMASIRRDKLRRSATPGTGKSPDSSKLLTRGSGSPRPARSPTKERIKTASRSRLRTYSSQLSSQSDHVKNEIEPAFVNDNYWLLFPFHAYWDTSATVTDQGMQKLPIGTGSADAGLGEVSRGGWRLHARRHLGSLRRQRQPRRAIRLPPRRAQAAAARHRDVDRLQKGRSSAGLNRAPRHRRWQAPAHLHF